MPESSSFGPEKPDDVTDALTPKKRRGGSALSRYLFQRRSTEQAHISDSVEADKATEEKPKRFKGLLHKVFPKIVEKSEIATQTTERRFDYETLFSWDSESEQSQNTASITESPEQVRAGSDVTEMSSLEAGQPVIEGPVRTADEIAVDSPLAGLEITPHVPPVVDLESVAAKREQPLNQTFTDNETVHIARPEAQLFHNESVQPTIHTEAVVERRGSALPYVLLGAEYIGRKNADTKLEKRVNEKITQTNNEMNLVIQLQQELDRVVQQNREQLETLKQQRPPEVIAAVEHAQPDRKPEQMTQPEARPIVRRVEQVPDKREKEYPDVVQRKIFEQVAEAAEQNVPVERVFERSHEVKDDTSTPVGATSVGAVMATKATQSGALNASMAAVPVASNQSGLPIVSDAPDSVQYRQAMKYGFLAAITLIIVGSIAYLVIQ